MSIETPTDDDVTTVLAELRRVDSKLHSLDSERAEAIRKARAEGATWGQIGEALKISKQAAWERFRSLEKEES
jgi:DNA-directed RNA polymerase specialized sigma24 family protein